MYKLARFILVLLLTSLIFSLVACSNDSETGGTPAQERVLRMGDVVFSFN